MIATINIFTQSTIPYSKLKLFRALPRAGARPGPGSGRYSCRRAAFVPGATILYDASANI